MTLWLVRAGSRGENESLALSENVVVIGWNELGDLSTVRDKDELLERLEQVYPDAKSKTLLNWRSQIWPFFAEMKIGDLVALPLKQRPAIAFGEVTGNYQYRPDFPDGARHTRPVRWIKEVPRSQIDQDLLYSFGAFMMHTTGSHKNNMLLRMIAKRNGNKLNQYGLFNKANEQIAGDTEESVYSNLYTKKWPAGKDWVKPADRNK